MLENFNDYMSLGVLVLISLFAIRLLFSFLFDHASASTMTRIKGLINYNENEDE